jgi:ectoine hydroxylase-related dioxygenase (phytanoyl-CoA dioxygenase family)
MAMKDIKDTINNKEGYVLLEGMIPRLLVADFNNRLKDLYPVRAVSSNKKYAERDDIKNLEDITVWWSQEVSEFPEVKKILKIVDPVITSNFSNLKFYASDTVFIKSGSTWINPHVDTPHRFKQYNYDKRLLGIQCIVSLVDTTKDNGSTGLVPFSQKRDFDIDKCYNGTYNRWFMENVKQHDMPKGSVLFYNCRVLHSSMPNNGDLERPALLLNYLDHSIIDEVSSVDNIWSSNGKRS